MRLKDAGRVLMRFNELRETLQLAVGVSAGESNVVQQMESLDELLTPIADHFGAEKRTQVEAFLRLQARLGLKRKVQEQTADPKLRAALDAQVQALRQEMDTLRRAVGVYCMAYLRTILPPETEPLWAQLDQSLLSRQPAMQLADLKSGRELNLGHSSPRIRRPSARCAFVSLAGAWSAFQNASCSSAVKRIVFCSASWTSRRAWLIVTSRM